MFSLLLRSYEEEHQSSLGDFLEENEILFVERSFEKTFKYELSADLADLIGSSIQDSL